MNTLTPILIGIGLGIIGVIVPNSGYILLGISGIISKECLTVYYGCDLVLSAIRLIKKPDTTGNPILTIYSEIFGLGEEREEEDKTREFKLIRELIIDRVMNLLSGLIIAFVTQYIIPNIYVSYCILGTMILIGIKEKRINIENIWNPLYIGYICIVGGSIVGIGNTIGILLIIVSKASIVDYGIRVGKEKIGLYYEYTDKKTIKREPNSYIGIVWAYLAGIIPGVNASMFTIQEDENLWDNNNPKGYYETIRIHTIAEGITLGIFCLVKPTGKSMLTQLLGTVSNPNAILILVLLGLGIGIVIYEIVGKLLIEIVNKEDSIDIYSHLFDIFISGSTIGLLSGYKIGEVGLYISIVIGMILIKAAKGLRIDKNILPYIPVLPILLSRFAAK